MALVLALILLLSLGMMAGCSEQDEQTPPAGGGTEQGGQQTPPAQGDTGTEGDDTDKYAEMYAYLGVDSVPDPEYSYEKYQKLLNGEIQVAFCVPAISQNSIAMITDGLVNFWVEKGATGQVYVSNDDVSVQISQIENCVMQGYDLVCVANSPISVLGDVCTQAREAGTKIVVRGEASIEACGFVPNGLETYSYYERGWYMADVIVAYMEQYNPDMEFPVKVAAGTLNSSQNILDQFQGIRDRMEQDGKAEIVYEMDQCFSIDDGYTCAEEALIYDPEIRAFIGFDEAPAIGFNNYIMANTQLDPAEFCVIGGGSSPDSEPFWDASATNESCYRGTCGTDYTQPHKVIADCSWKVLMGLVDDTNGYVEVGEVFIRTGFDYERGDGGFLAPEGA